jgi:hypothetical protein
MGTPAEEQGVIALIPNTSQIASIRAKLIQSTANAPNPSMAHKFTVTEIPPLLITEVRRADCDHDNLVS